MGSPRTIQRQAVDEDVAISAVPRGPETAMTKPSFPRQPAANDTEHRPIGACILVIAQSTSESVAGSAVRHFPARSYFDHGERSRPSQYPINGPAFLNFQRIKILS
jgi:hypothetical protein